VATTHRLRLAVALRLRPASIRASLVLPSTPPLETAFSLFQGFTYFFQYSTYAAAGLALAVLPWFLRTRLAAQRKISRMQDKLTSMLSPEDHKRRQPQEMLTFCWVFGAMKGIQLCKASSRANRNKKLFFHRSGWF
jgi:hypothetical protein